MRWPRPRVRLPNRPWGVAIVVLLVVAPLLATLAVASVQILTQQQREVFETTALAETRSILVSVPDGLEGSAADELGRALRRPEQLEVVVVDASGSVSRSSESVGLGSVPEELRTDRPELASGRTTVGGSPYLVVRGDTGPKGPQLYLFFSEVDLERETNRAAFVVAGICGTALVLLVGGGWLDTQRRLRSLARLRRREQAFTAHLGHELRTPVGALVTAASLVDDAELSRSSPVLQQPVAVMQTQARRLRRIVESLLELSRLETGQVQTRPEEVDLEEVATVTISSYGWDNIRLVVEGTTDVWADRQSVARLFLNLASNAVRHARDEVVVTLQGHGDEVVLEIADDGPGMPAHVAARALDQSSGAASNGHAGQDQGLGLLITRSHVALLGARMQIDTRPEHGTTVRVHLPATAARRTRR